MVIRDILIAIGLLMILVGISQFVLGTWWNGVSRKIIDSTRLRILGLIGLLIGGLFVYAAVEAVVNLHWYFWFLGLWSIVFSLVIIINPAFARRYSESVYLDRPRNEQLRFLYILGLIRILLGAIILYAVFSISCQC